MRSAFTFILLTTTLCYSYGQLRTHRLNLEVGANYSYTDCNTKLGYGAKFSYVRKLRLLNWRHSLGVGVSATVDRLNGGKNSFFPGGTNAYEFQSLAFGLAPRLDGSIYFGKFNKFEITPFASFGVYANFANGRILEQGQASSFYTRYGDDYFEPIYNDEGEVQSVVTKKNIVTGAFSAGGALGYYVDGNMKMYVGPYFTYSLSDNIDGLHLPIASNKSLDMFLGLNVGVSYIYHTKRRFRSR